MVTLNTLPYAAVEDVNVFLTNYVKENAILLPDKFLCMQSIWKTSSLLNCGNSFIQMLSLQKNERSLCDMPGEHDKTVRTANLPDHEESDCVRATGSFKPSVSRKTTLKISRTLLT